jgi:hypothetical protein
VSYYCPIASFGTGQRPFSHMTIFTGCVSLATRVRPASGRPIISTFSINGLSPRSPVLKTLDTVPITALYHSIIGDRGRGNSPNSSDGVVPYWSSHLEGAQSELIVPGGHGAYTLPQTVAELKRILWLELAARDQIPRKVAKKGGI